MSWFKKTILGLALGLSGLVVSAQPYLNLGERPSVYIEERASIIISPTSLNDAAM